MITLNSRTTKARPLARVAAPVFEEPELIPDVEERVVLYDLRDPPPPPPLSAATVLAVMAWCTVELGKIVTQATGSPPPAPAGRIVTIAEIQAAVAAEAGVSLTDMASPRRARSSAWPRQVAMMLAKELTPASLPTIGRHFGGRDHTTVMHGVRCVEQRLAAGEPDTVRLYEAAKRRLQG